MAPSDNPNLMAIGEVANDVLRKLGMDVDYVVTDWGTLVQRRANKGAPSAGGWSMFNTTWNGMDLANPGVSQMLRASGTQTYFGWPDIPELEKLRLAWIDSPDEAERKKLARDIQAVALREAVYIPTGQFFNHTAYSKRLVDIPRASPPSGELASSDPTPISRHLSRTERVALEDLSCAWLSPRSLTRPTPSRAN